MTTRGTPTGQSPTRPAGRATILALRCALRQLHRSVMNRRPITLPNLLRLFKRYESLRPPAHEHTCEAALGWLTDRYREERPFSQTDWTRWRGEIADFADARP